MWVKGIRLWPMLEEYVSVLLCSFIQLSQVQRNTLFNSRTIAIEGFKIPADHRCKHILLFYLI